MPWKRASGLALVLACVASTSFADNAYWQGDGNAWSGADNPKDADNGYWWNANSNGTGVWQMPSNGGNAQIYNGKECVITSGTVVSGDDVAKIFLNTTGGRDGSQLTVEDGATIGPNVGVVVGATGGNSYKSLSYLHIRGGNLKLGRAGSSMYSLVVGSANDNCYSRGFAWMDGGTVEISSDQNFKVGVGGRAVGSFALTNGSMTVNSATHVGTESTAAEIETDAKFIQAGGTFDEKGTFYVNRNSVIDLCGGTFRAKNLNLRFGGNLKVEDSAEVAAEILTLDNTPQVKVPVTNRLEVSGGMFAAGSVSASANAILDLTGGQTCVSNGFGFAGTNVIIDVRGTARLSVLTNFHLCNGGAFRVGCDACVSGYLNLAGASETGGAVGVTNLIAMTGGVFTNTCEFSSAGATTGWFGNEKYPTVIAVKGGLLWLRNLMTYSTKWFKQVRVSDGSLWSEGGLRFRWSTIFFKVSGAKGSMSFDTWDTQGGTGGNAARNSISEFELRNGAVSSIVFRNLPNIKPFGNMRLYPAGSIGLVGTNAFALMRFDKSISESVGDLVSSPDTTIWSTDCAQIVPTVASGHNWVSTLKAEATSGLLAMDGTATLEMPAPVGYFDLPPVKTNGLNKLDFRMKIVPPTDSATLEATLAKVKADLEDAGYVDVTTDAATADYNVSFSILPEQVPNRSDKTKLIFDFTRIDYESGKDASGGYPVTIDGGVIQYATTTNALLQAVSFTRDRDVKGMMILFR